MSSNRLPWVINVDKNPTYPAAVEALKADGTIPRHVVLRQCKYLNNVIEQDRRTALVSATPGLSRTASGAWSASDAPRSVLGEGLVH